MANTRGQGSAGRDRSVYANPRADGPSDLRAFDGRRSRHRELPTDPDLRALELRSRELEVEQTELEVRQFKARVERDELDLHRARLDHANEESDAVVRDHRNSTRIVRTYLALIFIAAITFAGSYAALTGHLPFERSVHSLIVELDDLWGGPDRPSSPGA